MRSKLQRMQDGRIRGGIAYGDSALRYLLQNMIYIGQVRHGEQVYEGEHEAIISPDLWEANQRLFDKATNAPRPRKSLPSPLNGFLEDGLGRSMRPSHGNRGNRRYRYYVSQTSAHHAEAAWRLPALDLETIIQRELAGFLNDQLRLSAELGEALKANEGLKAVCSKLADQVTNAASFSRLLDGLGARLVVRQDIISIRIEASKLLKQLACTGDVAPEGPISIDVEVQMRRRGHELKLIYAAPEARPAMRDDRLIQLLGQARIAHQQLLSGPMKGTAKSHAVRMARLNFLAPDIVTAILEGRQPVELTTRALLRASDLPMDWTGQRRMLGFL
ncbi:recombinase family protein [Rhizorhabdus wittichii]|nr:recombinase family protein [Rhizorhabdus wittichii]